MRIGVAQCALALGLTACGAGSGGSPAVEHVAVDKAAPAEVCDQLFADVGAIVEVTNRLCTDCEVEDLQASIDGDFDTVATVHIGQLAGAVTVSAKTVDGQPFPPGYAGVFSGNVIRQSLGLQVATLTAVTAFMNGAPVGPPVLDTTGTVSLGVLPRETFDLQGSEVSSAFNRVDFLVSWAANSEPGLIRISEFCSGSPSATGAYDVPERKSVVIDPAAPDDEGIYTVDLMALYTNRLLQEVGDEDAVLRRLEQVIDQANALFENSGIPAHYRLKGLGLYTKASETLPTSQLHAVLAADPAVRQARESVAADVVVLLATRDLGADLCGYAGLFNGGVQADQPANIDPDLDGLAIVHLVDGAFRAACGDIVFAHELGHVLGGGHEATGENAAIGVYWKPYAHSWACGPGPTEQSRQVTVMHSDADLTASATAFSSPNVQVGGEVCGQSGSSANEASQADNARAITEALPYVANYGH